MMRRINVRLQRLEQEASRTPSPESREFQADLEYLGRYEMGRAHAAFIAGMNGDETKAEEARALFELAHTRRLTWTQADRDALEQRDSDTSRAVWEFMKALGPLGNGCYLNTCRLDVVDLTPAEVMRLAEAVRTKSATDLSALSDIVGRLRIDGHLMGMTSFEALVLRGEITS